ncbi:MAG UNVERIFIED_CONTAM: hypothetical protein LVR18_04395 [Planctomycetaceae bacterium]
MARMARSEYFTADENAVLFIRCRAHRPLIPSSDQADTNAGNRRVGYIEDLIRLYARHFAISVHAHAVTHNEIRLVLQSRPELLSAVDDAQIARRWLSACPTLRRGRTLSDEPSEKRFGLCAKTPAELRSSATSSATSHGGCDFCNSESLSIVIAKTTRQAPSGNPDSVRCFYWMPCRISRR